MKKVVLKLSVFAAVVLMMTSCYTYTATIGKGPQTGEKITKHNHYLIDGLAPVATVDVKEVVGDAKDYSITVKHTFVDGLLLSITGGLYSPTTVIITK